MELIFNIKSIRNQNNISLYKLSKITGYSHQYLSKLEKNEVSNPTVHVLTSIAEALNVDVKKLFYTNVEINKLKNKLYKNIKRYGLNAPQTLEISQLIDLLITLDMQKKN